MATNTRLIVDTGTGGPVDGYALPDGDFRQAIVISDPTTEAEVAPVTAAFGLGTDVKRVPADPFGANVDPAVSAGATGSISAKLRRLTSDIGGILSAIGTTADAASITTVTATIVSILKGILNGVGVGATATDSAVTVTTTAAAALAANANRRALILCNCSTSVDIYISFGATPTAAVAYHLKLGPETSYEMTRGFTNSVVAVTATSTARLQMVQFT